MSCSEATLTPTLTLVTMVTMPWLVRCLALAALLARVQGQHEGSGGDLAYGAGDISMAEYIAADDGDGDYNDDGDDDDGGDYNEEYATESSLAMDSMDAIDNLLSLDSDNPNRGDMDPEYHDGEDEDYAEDYVELHDDFLDLEFCRRSCRGVAGLDNILCEAARLIAIHLNLCLPISIYL